MKILRKILLILVLFFFSLNLNAQTVKGGIFNSGSLLEVKAKVSGGDINGVFSAVVFTIRWNNNYGVSLGEVSSPYQIEKQGTEDTTSADEIVYRYQKFGATPNTNITWNNEVEYTLLTIPINQTGSGTGTFELAPSDFFTDIQEDWYVEISAADKSEPVFYQSETSGAPLPVELVSFKSNVKENGVELLWSTATELNNYGFDVQRKKEGENDWEKITFLEGAGNSNSKKYYNYLDKNLKSGTYQYRLKQIDNDGGWEFSNSIETTVNFIPKEFVLLQNYPNPFNPSTKIGFRVSEMGFVSLKIYDVLGNEIEVLISENKSPGEYEFEFNAAGLSSGLYIYQLKVNDFTATKKMTLLK